jgi:hypothetical protein
VLAASIEDYKNRLSLSLDMIEKLRSDEEDSIEGVYRIKNWLPQTEEIESDDQPLKVDNQWLHSLLDQYRVEKDEKKKVEKLDEVSGRLEALRTDIEKRESLKVESFDAKGEVRSILSRPEYLEKVEDPITKFIRETKQRAWNLIQEILNWALEALFGTGTKAGWLFRVIVFGALAFAVFIAVRMIVRFKRGKKREKTRTILGEEIEEGMTSRDLAHAAEVAARSGDFRVAIRKLYISLLYELAERRVIELEPNATNHDYLAKLAHLSALNGPMRYMTDRFDYTWYGMYPSSQDDYATYLSRYSEAMQGAQSIQERPA